MMPTSSYRVSEDIPNQRYLVRFLPHLSISRSWMLYGVRGAGIEVARAAWMCHMRLTGDMCPIVGLLSS
eukprot:9258804-Lingulodinium_polyedra.AAC.1